MLKKKLLLKKKATVVEAAKPLKHLKPLKPKTENKPKTFDQMVKTAGSKQLRELVEVTQGLNVALMAGFGEKPEISKVVEVFDRHRLRCSAIQIAAIRNPDRKLWHQRMQDAKKDLFKELLSLGLAKHISFKEGEPV